MAPGPGGDRGLGEKKMSPGEREEGVIGYDGKAGKWGSHRLCVCVYACVRVCMRACVRACVFGRVKRTAPISRSLFQNLS